MFRLVIPRSRGPRRPLFEMNGQMIFLPGLDNIRNLARPVAVLAALVLSLGFSSEWQTFAMFLHRPAATAAVDPVFGRPLSFFLFTLPTIEVLANWLLTLAVIVLIPAIVLSVADSTARFRGVSIALSFLLAAIAFQVFVSRYQLILDEHSLFTGVNYVADKVLIPALWLTVAALVAGVAIAIINIAAGRFTNLIIAIGIPVATYIVAGVLLPPYVSTFVVRPNELVRETPYIRNNIQLTREAFG